MKKYSRPASILAGDIGGTKTRLGLFSLSGQKFKILATQIFESAAYDGLEPIVSEFLSRQERISAACFGVPGPVVRGTVVTTNLPWRITEQSLKRFLSIAHVALMNDLVVNAYGIEAMKNTDFLTLNTGEKMPGNAALLSAGTGLGVAVLFWDGNRHVPSPSEGGHIEFGPNSRQELELLNYLFEKFGHVSYERLLSGSGLTNIYQYLRDSGQYGKEPDWLATQMKQGDPAALITETARLQKSRLCETAVDFFASIYGAAAGNLALQVMATAGVYIGGGIAPQIIWKLKDGTFMKAFRNKGRLSGLIGQIPVKVILNEKLGLLGAAVHAVQLLNKR